MAAKSTGSGRGFSDAEFGLVKTIEKDVDFSQKQDASPTKDNETSAADSGSGARRARYF